MKTVYKYNLNVGTNIIAVPSPMFKIIHVAEQQGIGRVWIEHRVSKKSEPTTLTLQVYGTGRPFPDNNEHVGTYQCGGYVWHVYKQVEEDYSREH